MAAPEFDPPTVRWPGFAPGEWLNASQPLTRETLRGQVVLVDFWEYTCVNCLRTLPYLVAWHRRYANRGLTIVGVHAPEFAFGRDRGQIEAAVAEFNLPYPILLDNAYQTWEQFANRAWPTKYLIDAEGYIRLRQQGEGGYGRLETAIQTLLRRRDPDLVLPDPLPPLRAEDAPGAVCYRTTPELHTGYQGGGLFGGALGNDEGYMPEQAIVYELPPRAERREGQFYLGGIWRARPESFAFAGQSGGRLVVPYRAAGVSAVLSQTSDPVELMLDIRPSEDEPVVAVKQDGRWLTPLLAGADIQFDEAGRSIVRVARPRLVELVRNPEFGVHELELTFEATGLSLYTVTFATCVAPVNGPQTFRMP